MFNNSRDDNLSFCNSANLCSFSEQEHNNETFNDNSFPFLNENLLLIRDNQNPEYSTSIINIKSNNCEKQPTKWATLVNDNNIKKEEYNYDCVLMEEIKQNLPKFGEFPVEKFIKNKKIQDLEIKLCGKEWQKLFNNKKIEYHNKFCILFKKEKDIGEKKKRGRKIETENKYRKEHNKYSENNIIIKIKSKLLLYALKFINNILQKNINRIIPYKLYKLNYQYTQRLKKKEDLNILGMSLKDIFSLDVSSKFIKKSNTFNKNTINKIIKQKELKNYQTIIFIFNLSFKEWINLFTHKKTVSEIINNYGEGYQNIINEIEKNIIYVEELLKDILKENDEEYFSLFTLLLYNYEKWFLIKKERRNI